MDGVVFTRLGHYTIIVNDYRIDFKFSSTLLDKESIKRAVEVVLLGVKVKISPLEENIVAKVVVLSSLKDLEDALWLMIHHFEDIDWDRIRKLLKNNPIEIIEKMLKRIVEEFPSNVEVERRVNQLYKMLNTLKSKYRERLRNKYI